MFHTQTISFKTTSHECMVPITDTVLSFVNDNQFKDGIVHLFVKHTTCGLTVNENADPNVVHDILLRLQYSIPWNSPNDRHLEGNSSAHLKSSFFGSSVSIPFSNSSLLLGTWQGVFLCEFDGPRTRSVHFSIVA